ncbi:MAG: N-(5'-phosphoribosyl)anthranilate isomerase, partial [Kiritimatiellae bacterium]|nr:N-(5'-phosphoribosyl)anthranilate isomerase [Kiritimatiellia bacterium]
MTPKVKVCGVNDAAFARAAAARGVDYLGFIFEPSSPRFVSADSAASIAAALGPADRRRVRLVGVFVRQDVAEIERTMRRAGLDVVQ